MHGPIIESDGSIRAGPYPFACCLDLRNGRGPNPVTTGEDIDSSLAAAIRGGVRRVQLHAGQCAHDVPHEESDGAQKDEAAQHV